MSTFYLKKHFFNKNVSKPFRFDHLPLVPVLLFRLNRVFQRTSVGTNGVLLTPVGSVHRFATVIEI